MAIQWVTCPSCAKRAYPTRADARAAIRFAHETGLREYPACGDLAEDFWHIGHLPKPVRHGRIDATEYYRRYNS